MSKRIFILGGGRFGVHLATRLCEFGCEVLLADNNPERAKDLSDQGFHAIEMDADDEAALRESGALTADVVIVAIGENMQASILATLLLKQMQARYVVPRALDSKHAQVLERLDADRVILPVRDMAYRLADSLHEGTDMNRFPIVDDFFLGEIILGEKLNGPLMDLERFRNDYSLNVVLHGKLINGKLEVAETKQGAILTSGDTIWAVATRENLKRFEKLCGKES